MKAMLIPMLCAALLAPTALSGQNVAPSPYRGQEPRDIKALSPEDIRALGNGEGMGLAKSAELNRYPGPSHVLQLAEALHLSNEQRHAVQQVFDRMKQAAVTLGRQIIAKEQELDRAFATATIRAEELERRVGEIAQLQGKLRAAHLQAHLETLPLLNRHQAHQYEVLRGYTASPAGAEASSPDSGHGGHHGTRH